MKISHFWLSREVILGLTLTVLIAVPVIVFGGSKQVYVDKDAKGSEDGTAKHPYQSIDKALEHVKNGTEVHIAKGTYKEHITIPRGVKLFGQKKDTGAVVIKSDSNSRPTVTMKHQTELNFLTVEGGRHGVRVMEDAKVKIYQVKVKKSDLDGIHMDSATRDSKHRALIDSVEVENNDRAGIYSEKRDIVVINSNIHDNGSDGVDLAAGMKGWFEGNRINGNGGSGMKVILDGASVWTKSNSIRSNKREGVEVNAYGAAGNFGLKKAQLVGNGRYGIARVARTVNGYKAFGGIILGTGVNDNRVDANHIGSTSLVLRGF
ncbi:MAG: right-handed parallel beta-helix repeat-containing protein [Candidatus Moranbacteria bacterium]|jgi:hypothetical protein|nr:right-handed parallel beta-helix repeat-containing protein [Candidatus Moranbacteria bacterium]